MKQHSTLLPSWQCLLALAFAASLPATGLRAEIEPAAHALAKAVTAKLGSAQTIRLTATHKLAPGLGAGAKLEKGPITITVQRPNRFFAVQQAGADTREIAFDGKSLCVMHPGPKLHALEPLKAASIEQFADRMDERFGFRPPVAELLAKDASSQLFLHVTSAKVTTERLGFTKCDRLHFEQPGMTGDLWISKSDGLPRRYLLTFTDIAGSPTWDIKLTKWELNASVDEALFTKRPPADSQKVPMLKSR